MPVEPRSGDGRQAREWAFASRFLGLASYLDRVCRCGFSRGPALGTIVLLDLMGGVALLLWGLHMVQSGVMRALGSDFRRVLSRSLRNRFAAFAGGLGLTALLQSSTATGLMTASLAADGMVGLVP